MVMVVIAVIINECIYTAKKGFMWKEVGNLEVKDTSGIGKREYVGARSCIRAFDDTQYCITACLYTG